MIKLQPWYLLMIEQTFCLNVLPRLSHPNTHMPWRTSLLGIQYLNTMHQLRFLGPNRTYCGRHVNSEQISEKSKQCQHKYLEPLTADISPVHAGMYFCSRLCSASSLDEICRLVLLTFLCFSKLQKKLFAGCSNHQYLVIY